MGILIQPWMIRAGLLAVLTVFAVMVALKISRNELR